MIEQILCLMPGSNYGNQTTTTGKQRPEFDVQIFKQNNPSVSAKVDEIREKCGVGLCWIDREEKKRYIFS